MSRSFDGAGGWTSNRLFGASWHDWDRLDGVFSTYSGNQISGVPSRTICSCRVCCELKKVSWSISVDVGAPGASMPEAELAGGGSRAQGPI